MKIFSLISLYNQRLFEKNLEESLSESLEMEEESINLQQRLRNPAVEKHSMTDSLLLIPIEH